MTSNLMKLSELATLLDYLDTRSTINWCRKNNILVAHVGKAKYVASEQIEMFFDGKFKRFANHNYPNPDKVIDAYTADNKVELSESMGELVEKRAKKKYTAKKEMSKAALDFMNSINKSA
ncbi:MAG TPA: hypothetical protein VK783_16420 [Bacteroidia bacterium]|jgi:hypothetical protein|nr:hypothetical protein [Bacteroidia bacterium]